MSLAADRFYRILCGQCSVYVKAADRKRHPCWNPLAAPPPPPAAPEPPVANDTGGAAVQGHDDHDHNMEGHDGLYAEGPAADPLLEVNWGLPQDPPELFTRAVPLQQPLPEHEKAYEASLEHASLAKELRLGPTASMKLWRLQVSTAKKFGVRTGVAGVVIWSFSVILIDGSFFFLLVGSASAQAASSGRACA
jgi:hypothetical protein